MLKTLLTSAVALTLAAPLYADIMVHDAYARSATPNAKSGAAFMVLMNHGETDDRLVAASSDIAARVELHTHREDANGVMRMLEMEDGFVIPAGGQHALARGGDHVMFMGLNTSLLQGETVSVTLTFENAGEMVVEIPVDLERKAGHAHGHKHDH